MYILFSVLTSLAVYWLVVFATRFGGVARHDSRRLSFLTLLVLAAALVLFNLASGAVGIDLGPFHTVSYNIPFDYFAKGAYGTLALIPYAIACASPAVARTLPRAA